MADASGSGVMGLVHSLATTANKGISHGEGWRIRSRHWLYLLMLLFTKVEVRQRRSDGEGSCGGDGSCGDGDNESGIHSHAARIEGGTGGGVVGVEKRNPVKTTGEGLDLPPPPIHDASYPGYNTSLATLYLKYERVQ